MTVPSHLVRPFALYLCGLTFLPFLFLLFHSFDLESRSYAMLQDSLVPLLLLISPLLVQCAPTVGDDQPTRLPFNDLVITQTVTSTYTQTDTTVTLTETASSSSSSSSYYPSTPEFSPAMPDYTPSPTGAGTSDLESASDPDAVLFLPPAAVTPTPSTRSSDLVASTSSSGPFPVQPTPTGINTLSAPRPQVMVYYPDWAAAAFPPEKIDFNRIDWIDFAFAIPDAKLNLGWDGSDDAPKLLDRLVTAAHARGKKVKLSIGGWTGSK